MCCVTWRGIFTLSLVFEELVRLRIYRRNSLLTNRNRVEFIIGKSGLRVSGFVGARISRHALRVLLFAGITAKLDFFHMSIRLTCRRNFQRGKICTRPTSIGKRQELPGDVLSGRKRRHCRQVRLVVTQRRGEFWLVVERSGDRSI